MFTPAGRQPNWSPGGDYILYQKRTRGRWEVWLYDLNRKKHRKATGGLSYRRILVTEGIRRQRLELAV
jgi:Tol biopolymer transport system component